MSDELINDLDNHILDLEAEIDNLIEERNALEAEVAYWKDQTAAADAAVDSAYQQGFSDGRCET